MALRINREKAELLKDPIENIEINFGQRDIFRWDCFITGPKNSPYEGHVYEVSVRFPSDYPFKPPKVNLFILRNETCI